MDDTCKWLVSDEVGECGAKAITKVRIRNRVVDAMLPVCTIHKAMHDSNFAQLRTNRGNRKIPHDR